MGLPLFLFISTALGVQFYATNPLTANTSVHSSIRNHVTAGDKIDIYTTGTAYNTSTSSNKIVYAREYGFSPSATASVNTKAAQKISVLINSMSGGVTLVIEKGSYLVGKESFAAARKKGSE